MLVLVVGCNKPTDPPTPSPIIQDSIKAKALVATANNELAQKMDEAINQTLVDPDSSFRPRDIDFTGIHKLYDSAAHTDTTNKDAKFGSAFTGLLVFLADPDFNTFVDDVNNLVDTTGMLKAPGMPKFDMGGPEVITGIPFFPGKLAGILPNLTKLDRTTQLIATSVSAGSPTISRLQNTLETQLVPKLETARQLLNDLINDPNYVFVVTPAMQGNPGANSIVITHADFQVFCATIEAIEASLYVFFSRNLDLSSYTNAGVVEALNQGTTFLDIIPGKMVMAKAHLFSAMALVDSALTEYMAKASNSGDHSHDLVKVYTKDIPNMLKARDSLRVVRGWFNGPISRWIKWSTGGDYVWDTIWWGSCSSCWYIDYRWHETFDSTYMKIDISKFFDTPVENPKRLLPGYTLTRTELPDFYKQFAASYFDRNQYWDFLASIYQAQRPNDTSADLLNYGFKNHLPETDSDAFYSVLAGNGFDYDAQQFVFGWDDLSGYYNSPYLWNWSSEHLWKYLGYYHSPLQVETRFTWTADTYAMWEFPNPTFSGLFPDLTSYDIKRILKVSDSWRRVSGDTTGFRE